MVWDTILLRQVSLYNWLTITVLVLHMMWRWWCNIVSRWGPWRRCRWWQWAVQTNNKASGGMGEKRSRLSLSTLRQAPKRSDMKPHRIVIDTSELSLVWVQWSGVWSGSTTYIDITTMAQFPDVTILSPCDVWQRKDANNSNIIIVKDDKNTEENWFWISHLPERKRRKEKRRNPRRRCQTVSPAGLVTVNGRQLLAWFGLLGTNFEVLNWFFDV